MLKFDIHLNNNELLYTFKNHKETVLQIQYIDKYTEHEISDIYIKVYGFKHNKPKIFLVDDFVLFVNLYYADNKNKPMTINDLDSLLKYIQSRHPYSPSENTIKYIYPYFDMRDGRIHRIDMYVGTADKIFSLTGEDEDKNLFKWIVFYLENLDF